MTNANINTLYRHLQYLFSVSYIITQNETMKLFRISMFNITLYHKWSVVKRGGSSVSVRMGEKKNTIIIRFTCGNII